MVDQHRLRADHVADGDDRQVEPVGLAGRRIGRGGAGRAQAAADDVGADDEEAVGVDDLAGPDQHVPPAGLAGHRMGIGDMLVAGQRVADEDGVGAGLVELAIGLVGDLEGRQQRAGVELQRLVGAEAQHRARRLVGLVALAALARRLPSSDSTSAGSGFAGNKKPALRSQSRLPRSKRPFSDLFNVAASRPAKSPRNRRF